MTALDIIIPVYNEELEVVQSTVSSIGEAFGARPGVNIFVVDDGSDASYGLSVLADDPRIHFLQHKKNRGYGQSLKTGILSGSAPWIAITDADGTYPVAELPKLVDAMEESDMVIGTRTGAVRQIPPLRRLPKKILNLSASYMADVPIVDLNSGMRVFSRQLCYYLWPFFPSGFSFTSTLTMGAHLNGFRVAEIPINYFKRSGQSSIKPIQDTYRFFRLVARLGLIFNPMRLFGPVAVLLVVIGLSKGLFLDFVRQGAFGNVAVTCILVGIQVLMLGLIGKLIVHSRLLGGIAPEVVQAERQLERRVVGQ